MTRIGVVVPTLGHGRLPALLAALSDQTLAPSQVVVVDQSREGIDILGAPIDLTMMRRPPGLSAARNAGVRLLRGWDAVAFTDDDTQLGPDALAAVARRLSQGADIVCGRVVTGGTTRVPFPPAACRVERATVWRSAMEPGLAMSREAWARVVGFDEHLGLGAPNPWQSGEGTDLLLRALDSGLSVWFDPAFDVVETPVTVPTAQDERDKARRYARGTGRVFALNYGPAGRGGLVVRSVGRLARHLLPPRPAALALDLQVLAGRIEGLTGRVIPAGTSNRRGRGRGSTSRR